jgi:CRP/FNR family transcriptional regulator, cyclic AMP receptor protein
MEQVRTYLELLMKTEDRPAVFEAGQVVFEAGQPGDKMYVVQSGSVELRSGERLLETVGVGGVLGELALVDQEPRSATAVAVEPSRLVAIDQEYFMLLVKKVPGFALEVMRIMSRRLRRVNPSDRA